MSGSEWIETAIQVWDSGWMKLAQEGHVQRREPGPDFG